VVADHVLDWAEKAMTRALVSHLLRVGTEDGERPFFFSFPFLNLLRKLRSIFYLPINHIKIYFTYIRLQC
jgi:hypothetical protein